MLKIGWYMFNNFVFVNKNGKIYLWVKWK
jgi:hypothetical protein